MLADNKNCAEKTSVFSSEIIVQIIVSRKECRRMIFHKRIGGLALCSSRMLADSLFNPQLPNDIYIYIYIYMSYLTANLQMLHFIYYSTNIRTEYFKHAAHVLQRSLEYKT